MPAARRALFILIFAAALWLTDAIPAFAVGILIIGLRIALLGRPGGVFARTERDWEAFVVVIGDPLVWLFFGGFVLAAGMSRTGLDRWFASRVLGRFSQTPTTLLLGVMLTAFVLSMFMSNTATTAMIVAMLGPIMASRPEDDRLSTGLLLSVAVAGMATSVVVAPHAAATDCATPAETTTAGTGALAVAVEPAISASATSSATEIVVASLAVAVAAAVAALTTRAVEGAGDAAAAEAWPAEATVSPEMSPVASWAVAVVAASDAATPMAA